jgi:hypothetical protein
MALLDMFSEITRKIFDTVLAFSPLVFSKKAKLYDIQTESLTLDLILLF